MNPDLVSALCNRMTKPSAEIILEQGRGRSIDVDLFIRKVATHSTHWKSFVHADPVYPSLTALTDEEMEDLARETRHLQTPFLSQLSIHYPPYMLEKAPLQSAVYYYSSWSLPRLNSFTISNVVPVPFAASSSLTYFKVTLECERSESRSGQNLTSLIHFLTSCTNLKTFALHLLRLMSITESAIQM